MIILGAGMAGCLAGALNPKATILEAGPGIPDHHKAVLRFRDCKISRTLGIEFKPVTVHKSIWCDSESATPSPRLSNLYSHKVTGKFLDRSINNLETVTRYIAPSDFHLMLGDMCQGRVEFNHRVTSVERGVSFPVGGEIISTIPMPVLMGILGIEHNHNFQHSPISVTRFEIPNCDVHQTIYYPGHETSVYRSTLTGSDLIVESIGKPSYNDLVDVANSFGIESTTLEFDFAIPETKQQYGKIAPIDEKTRKDIIYMLSQKYGIFSLGRFATWRNILLDDVYDDIYTIKRLANGNRYDAQLEEAK